MDSLFDSAPAPARPIVDLSILAAARADAAAPTIAPPGRAAPPAPVLAGIDHAGAAASLVEFAAVSFFPLYPSLEPVYPKEKRDAIAAALAPVLKKYDIDLNALPPELILAIVIVPTIPAAIAAVRADRIARARAAQPAPSSPPGAPHAEEKKPSIEKARSALVERFPGIERAG